MPFTVNKKLSVQAAGSNSAVWGAGSTGNDLNTGVIGLLDTIVAGLSSISLSASNYSLTFVVGGGGDVSNCMLRFTGTLLANIVVSPAAGDATTYFNGFYHFENLTTGNFNLNIQNAAGSILIPQNRRGLFFVDSVNGPRIISMVAAASGTADPIPAGSTVLFLQAAAPTGWTQNQFTNLNDYALRLVNGTGAGTHGVTGFSTVFNQTATAGYTLQLADTPFHQHFIANTDNGNGSQPSTLTSSNFMDRQSVAGASDYQYALQGSSTQPSVGITSGQGGNGAHAHGISLQPLYVDVINAARN